MYHDRVKVPSAKYLSSASEPSSSSTSEASDSSYLCNGNQQKEPLMQSIRGSDVNQRRVEAPMDVGELPPPAEMVHWVIGEAEVLSVACMHQAISERDNDVKKGLAYSSSSSSSLSLGRAWRSSSSCFLLRVDMISASDGCGGCV